MQRGKISNFEGAFFCFGNSGNPSKATKSSRAPKLRI
ncbi:hypothetical protein BVRB_9g211020 [Beta vulgaris subsp. vulgaris]|nr:hypothetical protein BVRB_9g211020 [Beta vulgaris subsp. vulgaris]